MIERSSRSRPTNIMKTCSMCKFSKSLGDFDWRGPTREGEKFSYCKSCRSIRAKKELVSIKLETFNRYGGAKCNCCGESGHISFLALDHIDNNGAAERKELARNGGGSNFYKYLKKRGWPAGYQVLCHTCNVAKHLNGGVCPHKSLLVDSVIGNTSLSESEDSRFDP